MSPSADHAAWRRLGEQLTRRRVELNPRYENRQVFCTERGVDYRLIYDIEEAKRTNFRKSTLAGIAAAYAVTPESLNATLLGGELQAVARRASFPVTDPGAPLSPGLVTGQAPAGPARPPELPPEGAPGDDEPSEVAWYLFPGPDDRWKREIWRLAHMTELERVRAMKGVDLAREHLARGSRESREETGLREPDCLAAATGTITTRQRCKPFTIPARRT